MKKSYILSSIICLAFLIMLSACGGDASTSDSLATDTLDSDLVSLLPSSSDTVEESPSATTSEIESPSQSALDEGSISEEPDVADTSVSSNEGSEYKMVGADAYGFVNVPSDWVIFVDEGGTEDLQYSDPTGSYIVTLSYGELYGYTSPETWASGVMAVMQSYGSTDLEGARVDFNGYDSYQCYGTFPDATILVANIFTIDGGQIRYLSVEGPISGSLDYFSLYETITGSYTIESPAVG